MFATYVTVGNATRSSLGNTTAYAAAVLADWVGLLTGTITSTSQLSSYADKPNCSIVGAAGDWTVYDSDAHYSYSGIGKVLRRLNVGGVGYQYMWIGFRVPSADYLNGLISFMGGWDSVAKAPTTIASSSVSPSPIAAGTVYNSTNVPLSNTSGAQGAGGYAIFNSATAAYAPVPYNILSAPGVCAVWPQAVSNITSMPRAILAEHDDVNVFSNAANGCAPLVFGGSNGSSDVVLAPHVRAADGSVVAPTYAALSTVFFAPSYSSLAASVFYEPSSYLTDYVRNAAGVKSIPVVPIEVRLKCTSVTTPPTYCGRLRSVYATLAALYAGDTFTVGSDTYVVIPTTGYSSAVASYSSSGKLCAKVQ